VVVRRTGQETGWVEGRDVWYHELTEGQSPDADPEPMGAEDPLYILYTSGSTGKPKGILHTTGGYLTGAAATHRWVFDLKDDDVYWCAADVGWVTGHSYIVYGPLANGASSILYEGAPGTPGKDRWWDIVERYRVTILYCAPTAIRTFMKWGTDQPAGHDLSSLRLLGTVGEPINPEAWIWYRTHIGGDRCPVVDTWWQTETGHIMISGLPGITTLKPGSAGRPLPGITADVVNEAGESVPLGQGGYLVLTKPWPGMLRTLYGDDDRFVATYWSQYPGKYLAGDGARRDADGDFWLLGRIDDVMNVSGHRLSTIEIESALVDHPKVAEAAVVGRADETTGQAIAAFVTVKGDVVGDEALIAELRQHVATKIGAIARPRSIVLTDDLPKTRSGKIMRRLLRDISENRQLGDVTTLANEEVVAEISGMAEKARSADSG
jgi:acetyl-CoA synthetase